MFPFTRDRFRHEVLESDGDVCLVARTNLVSGSVHWEVVRLIHEPERRWPNGSITPAHTRYPGDVDWGVHGWTYTTRPDAERKYRFLVSEEPQRGGSMAKWRVTG